VKTREQRSTDELSPVLGLRVELLTGSTDQLAISAVVDDHCHRLIEADSA